MPLAGRVLCILWIALWMVPRWLRADMFVDGVTYATIARNLSESASPSLWHLHYTPTLHPQFFEQPPLGIAWMAIPFFLFGDVAWAETLHSVVMTVAFCIAAGALWRAATSQYEGAFLYSALLFSCPLTSWVLANDLLEGPMTIFCLLAVAALLTGAKMQPPHAALWGSGAALCLAAAFLCKGPVALFVLVLLPHLWLTQPQERRWALYSMAAAMGLCTAMVVSLLYWHHDAHAYLAQYFHQQVWQSLTGQRERAAWRGIVLMRLIGELGMFAVVAAMALCWFPKVGVRKMRELTAIKEHKAQARLLLSVALAASLPLVLSPKQSGAYVFPSLPFFLLAASLWAPSILEKAISVVRSPAVRVASRCFAAMTTLGLLLCTFHEFRRPRDFTSASVAQFTLPERNLQISVCSRELQSQWRLHALLARRFGASLALDGEKRWCIVDTRHECERTAACTCASADRCTSRYALFHCQTK